MKYRPHRGSLADSMARMVVIPTTWEALSQETGHPISELDVKPVGYDARTEWATCIVTAQGKAIGYTDRMLPTM